MTETASAPAVIEAAAYREAMARLASAVHVVTTDGPAGRAGFTASAVCSVSDAPPTLLVCLNHASSSHRVFGRNEALCVNTLSATQAGVAATFSSKLSAAERFAGGGWSGLVTGAPVLDDCLVAFDCRIVKRVTVGSHDVLFCEVVGLAAPSEADGLVYADRRYHAVPWPRPVEEGGDEPAVERRSGRQGRRRTDAGAAPDPLPRAPK